MENNEIMNDMEVMETEDQALEVIEEKSGTHPVVYVAAGVGFVAAGKFVYKRMLKPIGRKIKGLFKKDKPEVIECEEYAEVEATDIETEE